MRPLIWGWAVVLGLAVASGAGAERYLVNAGAGSDGEAHEHNDDPDAFADFSRSEIGGDESYQASANANGGSLFASASRSGTLSPSSTTAFANIEETIHFDELPPGANDTVTIRATLGVGVSATASVGVARAFGQLTLIAAAGQCNSSKSAHSVLGDDTSGSCSTPIGSADGGSIEMTLTREQLLDSNVQVDILASVSAELEDLGAGFQDAVAVASGGVGFSRGGEPIPGTLYVEIDPPLDHSYTGSMTTFPVPEPGAPLLAAVGGAVLLASRRRV